MRQHIVTTGEARPPRNPGSASWHPQRSVAAARGVAWADEMLAGVTRRAMWPRDSRIIVRLALFRVADLAADLKLRGELAEECATWAERHWQLRRVTRSA